MSIVPSGGTGPVTVSREQTVDPRTANALWDLFSLSFAPLRRRAAARHLLTRDDFTLEVLDPRVAKYLARTTRGEVIGLATLTNDLETVPWVSSDFYRSRYADYFARGAVFYCGVAMVHPDARSGGVFRHMFSVFTRDIAVANGVLAADMCRFNVDVFRLDRIVTDMLKMTWGSVSAIELDRQSYLAWEPVDKGRDAASVAASSSLAN